MSNIPDNRNALPNGYRLGDYQIQRVLGDGAFGITYLAQDTQLETPVAIKEYLPNELAVRDGDYTVQAKSQNDVENFRWGLERFIKEARILAQLRHPNIVRVLRFFEAHHTAYIVMEYEEGQSLARLIKDGDTATEEEIMTILPPLLDGLEVVHQAGYLHRDIKPANIYMRTSDNSPVLIDFGAARYDVGSRSRTLTAIVTPGYAPFEQYETKGNQQGAWTDIYALGAVLYKLIGGKTPIESPERIGSIVRRNPDPLTSAIEIGRGFYSPHLLEAIDWALKINEKDRPQNIGEWRDKLLKKPAPPPFPPPEPPPKGWKPSVVIGTIAILLLIIVGGMYFFMSSQPTGNVSSNIKPTRYQTEMDTRLAEAEQARVKAETEARIAKAEQARLKAEAEARLAEAEQARLKAEIEARMAANADEERRRQAPVNVVRSYYEDLDRNNASSALSKRIGVKNKRKVRNIIRGIDWFRVNSVKLNSFSSSYATVSVDVTGKQKTGRPERWVGTIDLENVGGEWKISRMNF
jgi:serine/threonine protein kinase